jgi:hypothetical protein
MFENWYSFTDINKIFPKFYAINTERINLLYTQVLEVRFNKDPTLTVENNIDVYNVRQDQIEIILKRRTLRKAIKRSERNKENEEDSNIHSYKRYKSKKDFESVLNNEIKKQKRRDQSKESPKLMSLLKSLKTKTTMIQKS